MGYTFYMDKDTELKKIHEKWSQDCKCELRNTATQPVPGDGPANAEIVFIGEAPGKDEDREGRPFVGRAGKFLSEMLETIKMKREDIYITNIVKYRPPENRDPTPEEIHAALTVAATDVAIGSESQESATTPRVLLTSSSTLQGLLAPENCNNSSPRST
jgi:uracil-DNA glycosylase family 4